MARCDICGRQATQFVSCDQNGMGGNPSWGSFRSFRCDPHAREAIDQHAAVGMVAKSAPLSTPETRNPCELCNGTGQHQDGTCPDCGGNGHEADRYSATEGVTIKEVA